MFEPMLLVAEGAKLLALMVAGFTSVKMGLNGVRSDVKEIKVDVKEHGKIMTNHEVRITVLEKKE